MATIYVKFNAEEDRVRGFYELARRTGITSFRGKVYQVPTEAIKILDASHIDYRHATDEEIREAHDQVRNPAPAIL